MTSVSAIAPGASPQRVQPVTPQRREPPAAPAPEGGTAAGVATGVTGSSRPGFGAEAGAALLEAQSAASRPEMSKPRPSAPPPPSRPPRDASPEAATTPHGPGLAIRPSQQDQAARDTEAVRHREETRTAEPPGRGEQERAAAAAAYAARGDRAAGAPALRLAG